MCNAPKPPQPKEPKEPQYLRNPYVDQVLGKAGAVNQLRTGRSQLRIDLGSQTGLGLNQSNQSTPNSSGPANRTTRQTPNRLEQLRARLPSLAALR